jgi:hypothetical protein
MSPDRLLFAKNGRYSPVTQPTEPYMAERAQELKVLHLGLMLSIPSLFDPGLPILRTMLAQVQETSGDLPLYVGHAPDDEEKIQFSAREILTKLSQLRGDIVSKDLLSISMLLGGTRIGDLIVQGNYSRSDVPLLQFARHFRNACAHGDRWYFKNGEPRYPAACRGLTLDASLDGNRATYETVSPRLYLEFLDDISNYFLPGAVPPPAS